MLTGTLTAVSLFAGIGGIDLALHRAGIRVAAAVEIDPSARGVLATHFPDTVLFNDVREVIGDQLRAAGFDPRRGLLAAGWPCQDLSVAGLRQGLGGARSGLFWQVVRLLAELRPRWFLLENVPGLLSAVCPGPARNQRGGSTRMRLFADSADAESDGLATGRGSCPGGCMAAHGGAMGLVVGALVDLGYGVCWRVLDAQHFGVPQRRRRVVFVGCLGDGAAPVQVLLEPEGGGGNPAPRGQARSDVAGVAALRASVGGADDNDATGGRLIVGPLQAEGAGGRGHRVDAEGAATGHLVTATVSAKWAKGTGGPAGDEAQNLVAFALRADPGGVGQGHNSTYIPVGDERIAHALTAEGHDASEDGIGRGTPLVAMAFNPQTGGSEGRIGYGPTPTALTANQKTGVHTAAAVRRLTPVECERLQGFPDGWTATSSGQAQSDSARYRQLGNSVAVPVFEWVGGRIALVDATLDGAQ